MLLLSDETKFLRLGPVSEFDRIVKIETETCHHLKRVMELNEILENEFNILKPFGSSRPRMYGLPKIHKAGCPLRPIMPMSVVVWLDCSMFHEAVGLGMLQTLGGPGPVGVSQMVVHFCLEGVQSLAGGSFAQEVAWEVVPLPYSSIWKGSQEVVPRLSRKCTFQLECMASRDFGAVAGSDVL